MQDPNTRSNENQLRQEDDGRSVWIFTGYAASFLALLGVLAFYFSDYVTR
jgi:hypothetical protein